MEKNKLIKIIVIEENRGNMIKHTVLEKERIKKHEYLLKKYKEYNCSESGTSSISSQLSEDKLNQGEVKLFGRIMARRDMGKSMFLDIIDDTARIQLFVSTKNLDEVSLDYLNNLDVGDFVTVKGTLMKTKTGQLSLRVSNFRLVTKCITPLPDKWHGLKNEEDLIRKRYLDLLLNKDRRAIFEKRQEGIDELRRFFKSIGCKEVQTPSVSTLSTGATARPFETFHNTLDSKMFLRIAPELYLKRLIAGNFGRVFEIARCFRNEGISNKHNPEFDLAEIYIPNSNMNEMMSVTEEAIRAVALKLSDNGIIKTRNNSIDFNTSFKRISMREATKSVLGYDILALKKDKVKEIVKENKIDSKKATSVGLVLNELFEKHVEKTLVEPTLIFDYPTEVSPLAKKSSKDARFASRFELFFCGVEVANGYSEQNDFFEQQEAFIKQAEKKKEGDVEAADFDEDYLIMLKHGLPPTGGLGIGVDRLLMLFLDLKTIKDIILFPAIKIKD